MNGAIFKPSSISQKDSGHEEDAARKKGEVVHSGHFMISSVADQEEVEEVDHDRDSPVHHEQTRMIQLGYDFSNVSKGTKKTYQFGPLPTNQITIDASLAGLFKCMSLAYQGGKVVSPKWKNFKGLKLTVKDKIRLNNAIWRTWHIQYVMRKRREQSFIQFATPMEVDYNWYAKPEAVVMEGKYWKMRIDSVVADYKKWRGFFMEKLKLTDYPGLMWVSENTSMSPSAQVAEFEKPRASDGAQLNEFSDTLFSSLSQQPFEFPNAREIAMHTTNSDMMQPGLLQLQPAVDDFIDFDVIQDLLNPPKNSTVHFSGVTGQNFTQTPTEMYETNSLTSMLESNGVQQTPKDTDISYNQSICFMNDFQAPKNLEQQPNQQAAFSADPTFPVVNASSVPPYPANRLQQQATMGQAPAATVINVDSPSLPNYNQARPAKPHPMEHSAVQQQILPKPNAPGNASFLMSNNVSNPLLSDNPPPPYPLSNVGSNSTSNRTVFTQAQTSQEIQYFSPSRDHVVLHQSPANNPVPVDRVQTQAGNLPMSRLENPTTSSTRMMSGLAAVRQVDRPQQPPSSGRSANRSTSANRSNVPTSANRSNEAHLKQLLSSKSNSTSTQNNRKRTNENQRYPAHSAQQSPSWPVTKTPQKSLATIMPASDQPAAGSQMDTAPPEAWQKFNAVPPSAKHVENVGMEQRAFEPVLPLLQDEEMTQAEPQQRRDSFSTEQRRRFTIKTEFSRMQKMLCSDSFQSKTKISKTVLMSKAVQQIQKLKLEIANRDKEILTLKEELENLKLSIRSAQQQLPATGAPVPRHRTEEAKDHFKAWARQRTTEDWKFYVFGAIIRPWFHSYLNHVSGGETTGLVQSVNEWLDTGCSLPVLRRGVVQSLQVLSSTTCILTNPSQIRKQIEDSVRKPR